MVKSEPQELKVPVALLSSTHAANSAVLSAKPEPRDTSLGPPRSPQGAHSNVSASDHAVPVPDQAPLLSKKYSVYQSAADIPYQPEAALREGLEMVKHIRGYMNQLKLGSKLRHEVWDRELKTLESQTSPKALIAVCGATGAGKSSILNALLDDNIVPTSGMRACTAVVTEIAYHDKKTIDADVSFLSTAEWKDELALLQHDLVEEDGSLKRTNDLKSDAGVAWSKVHAVYPMLSQQQLVNMSANQIIASDPRIANILGCTKNIVAKHSKAFGEEIAKYIDSTDRSRGKKKDKKRKDKDEDEGKSLMDKVREAAGMSKKKHESQHNAPAFWPLIRQVNVRCRAPCLSSGCVLVDLPGVADANAARNNIAKTYMKKAQCIWILAPITRAVDDKTARDLLGDAFKMQLLNGNYDDHAITFIASKTDDISCSEVISALNLEDDPELEEIEENLDRNREETLVWSSRKADALKEEKVIQAELKTLRAIHKEHLDHLEALRAGKRFVPTLTAIGSLRKEKKKTQKRKNKRGGKRGSPKRRRSSSFDGEDTEDTDSKDDEDSEESDNSDNDSGSEDSSEDSSDTDSEDSNSDDSDSGSGSDNDNDQDSDMEVEELVVEEVTEESVKAKADGVKGDINTARSRLSTVRKEKKDAADNVATLKKDLWKIQKNKNAWCSKKRSEFSRDVLKEDFRTGLKDLDDAIAEERDPGNFDPSVQLRDYDAINLPVFTCSSRDYVRLTNQVKGDGEPTCFSDKASTGIPDLQAWCHTLTISSRTRSARNFLDHLKAFVTSVNTFVNGIGGVTIEDRETLRAKWESTPEYEFGPPFLNEDYDSEDSDGGYGGYAHENEHDPFASLLGPSGSLYAMNRTAPKVDDAGEPIGITPRLKKQFLAHIEDAVEDMQELFRDGLEDKCRIGATLASQSAVVTSDNFAASLHWATYRATLRRNGEFRNRDLNSELLAPFTKNIAASWSKVFETDMFASFETSVLSVIHKLLADVEDSAAPGLKDRVKLQGDSCLAEAKIALQKSVGVVRETLSQEQKEVSRCLAPLVQDNLMDGYASAMEERGKGSVARQKAVFHNFISERKDEVFDEGADVMLDRLSTMCLAVGKALQVSFKDLAQKIEVNLAVLWEAAQDDPKQLVRRGEMMRVVTEILGQVQLWLSASEGATIRPEQRPTTSSSQ